MYCTPCMIFSVGDTACEIIRTYFFQISNLLQLETEPVLNTFLLGFRDNANNYSNDWFLLNTELVQPCRNIVFKEGLVSRKGLCFFFHKLVISVSVVLYLDKLSN